MKNLPLLRAAALTGTLVVGWALGYLMSGSPAQSGSATEEHLPGLAGRNSASLGARDLVQQWAEDGSGASGSSLGLPPHLAENAVANFETLMRGALRISDNTDRALRLREIARAIPVADLPGIIEKAKKLPSMERWAVMQAIGARWAEAAPLAAAEFALKQGSSRYGWNELLAGVIEKWATNDQQAAVTWIQKQPPGHRYYLLQSMIQSIARRDPQSALEVLDSQPDSYQMNWLHGQVFEQWCQRDPGGAAKAAEAMTGLSRDRALQSVAASWAAQDTAAALQWAQSFSDKNHQNRLLRSVAQAWAEQDANAVLKWAAGLEEPLLRQDALNTAITQLAQKDTTAVRAYVSSLKPGQERDNLAQRAIFGVSRMDAKAAMRLIDLLPEGPMRASTLTNVVTNVAQSDPKSAAEMFASLPPNQVANTIQGFAQTVAAANVEFAKEWAEQLPDAQNKSKALRSIASVMARNEPRAAAEWLLEKEPRADLTWLLQSWTRNAPADVLAWAKALPDGDAKRSAQTFVVQNLVHADLEQARAIFSRDLTGDAQVAAAGALANQWASRDVNAARAWAEALPPGGARNNAINGVMRTWAEQDAGAAAQWLERLPGGEVRDGAISQFANTLVNRDPATALEWANSVEDTGLRGNLLEQLAGRWLQADSPAARDWIKNSSQLSAGARQRLLNRSPGNGYYYNSEYYDYD